MPDDLQAAEALVTSSFAPQWAGQFLLHVDGKRIGTFTEVTGLSVEVETEEIKEGGQNHYVHEVPGRMKWPRIVLKRGFTDAAHLFEWFEKTSGHTFAGNRNRLDRFSAAITMLNGRGLPLRSWNFDNMYPVKWTGPTFAAGSSDVASAEIELVHHGFTSTKP
jgi:phage tail-like protein